MITFFKMLWAWIKKYWKIIALVAGAIVALVLFRGRIPKFSEDFQKIKDAHEEELRRIEAAREEERRLKVEADARLVETLKRVEEEYQAQQRELDEKKRKEIERIVKEVGDDPDELARRLSEVTGFRVILPQD